MWFSSAGSGRPGCERCEGCGVLRTWFGLWHRLGSVLYAQVHVIAGHDDDYAYSYVVIKSRRAERSSFATVSVIVLCLSSSVHMSCCVARE